MDKSKNTPLEDFHKILKQQHKKAQDNVNIDLYNDICNTAEIVAVTEDKIVLQEIIDKLRERFKNIDLNQVTDIFIYCQSFLSSNEDPVPMPSKLCISIGKIFTNENLHYTASKVYSGDELESGCALSFLGYLAMHEHHTPYILSFIKDNFDGFSLNNKTKCVFQLKETLPDNKIAKQIVEDSGITEYIITFSTSTDSISKPITFQIENIVNNSKISVKEPKSILPWWKFWSKYKSK